MKLFGLELLAKAKLNQIGNGKFELFLNNLKIFAHKIHLKKKVHTKVEFGTKGED